MPNTSSKCGITLDFTNAFTDNLNDANKITPTDLSAVQSKAKQAFTAVEENIKNGLFGFAKLPYTPESELDTIIATADDIARNFSDFVVLGIGGSALGNIAVQSALNHPFYNLLKDEVRPRLFILDNVDPEYINGLLDILPLEKTFFNVITKSGTTAETMSQYLIFQDIIKKRLGDKAFRKQFLFTTDPEKGVLRKIADKEGVRTLSIPQDVGGRFSVMTPVGLFSAAVTGINIKNFIAGARAMDQTCRNQDIFANPALMYAVIQHIMDTSKNKPMAVMMPYVQALKDLADWYRQLLAESIGKQYDRNGNIVNLGQTPIKALGATDQHSQVQLYKEGPYDKIITFIGVKNYRETVKIPDDYKDIEQLSYLGNKTLNQLIKAEQDATTVALARSNRPSCTITLDKLDAKTLGALMYMFEYQIAIAGELYNIDAFDQPGVEEGKNLTYAMMGRKGYEDQKELVEQELDKKSDKTVISW
ncbi:glucose-6-phosphate isomerase [bacterium]|nr:glucose-6-phosphate isomerase [bacterium]